MLPTFQSWTARKMIECLTQGLLSSHWNIYHSTTAYFFEPPCISESICCAVSRFTALEILFLLHCVTFRRLSSKLKIDISVFYVHELQWVSCDHVHMSTLQPCKLMIMKRLSNFLMAHNVDLSLFIDTSNFGRAKLFQRPGYVRTENNFS